MAWSTHAAMTVHHPIAAEKYYEEQKEAAIEAAKSVRASRIPKFFDHFEAALGVNDGPFVLGEKWTPVDTSLFQLIEGLSYAFPQRMATLMPSYPRLHAMREAVAQIDRIAAYLASDRRIPFNEQGLFRHYPELDAA